ncbi:metal-dependent transcriptional regulator [Schaalia sp. ZJ405]|uniref:metal-dependent transcriptional regulator n=1 Tax=Schaalia sp. ZJ405 TaxID=2709403 RepID=UPI0013E9CE68|nr:metal-dependent transcriptional regulator [Schaalia sp. ZJ405]QPK81022.1 metal-dependent transcriptional regulator [Schaalia sp. ZJ405]
MAELIDTTEMYLKTILEMEEDGVTPLRARIVERLGHSGPTVSQTVARMERSGLLHVMGDRRLELTEEGRAHAIEVLRKHRLAERLLLDVIGLDWHEVHEEACRWEHVMSDDVEKHLEELLQSPQTDPYGNAIPGRAWEKRGESLELTVRSDQRGTMRISRIGEPIQAEPSLLESFQAAGIMPGSLVDICPESHFVTLSSIDEDGCSLGQVSLPNALIPHLFVEPVTS